MIPKFRVWDIEDKCFCYIPNIQFYAENESRILDGIPRYVGRIQCDPVSYKMGKDKKPIYKFYNSPGRYIIHMSTNQTDRTGRWIYAGDLVRYKGKLRLITWDGLGFQCADRTDVLQAPAAMKEVVGNYFESNALTKEYEDQSKAVKERKLKRTRGARMLDALYRELAKPEKKRKK